MILRVLNFMVIGALVLAAAYVYRIKFDSTVQAEHLAKLRSEARHERDTIAALRAEWGQLDDPARIEDLSKQFLKLKPIVPTQFDQFDGLPERPPDDARAANDDPIGGIIGHMATPDTVTGSIPATPPSHNANATPAAAPTPIQSPAPQGAFSQ